MNRVFTGLLLIFLDFNLTINGHTIGLMPDFLGYISMAKGLSEIGGESPRFEKVRPYSSGMAVYTGILYLMDLAGISAGFGIVAYLLGLVATVILLYISFSIVKGIRDIEDMRSLGLNSAQLYSVWLVSAVFRLASYLLIIVPVLRVVCILGSFIVAIFFLTAFNKSRSLYYSAGRK